MKIGDRIRFIRDKERNYTQAYVAMQLDMSPRAYGNIENNLSDPTFSRLLGIAEVFGCDIGYLISAGPLKDSHPNLPATMQPGNVSIEALYNMYEDIKRLHAEITAIAKRQ